MYPIDLETLPPGYEPLEHETPFNPDIHLQLEWPEQVFGLNDLGYSEAVIAEAPAEFAATTVFRVLSDEGAVALYASVKQLEAFATSNPRIERNVRGGVYRSRFLRDLCLCPQVTAHLSKIAGLDLMPHTIPHQLGHLNFNPREVGKNVDKWHVDTLRFDYVMFVTDPTRNEGGQFQYFNGTKQEIADLKASGQEVPPDRVISPAMPGPGYAILQQGNLVVHQAKGLTAPGERITMVNGYVPRDPSYPDYSRFDQLLHVDPIDVVGTEYARHSAVQAQRYLAQKVVGEGFGADHEAQARALDHAAEMLRAAAANIRAGKSEIEHFGD